MRFTGLLIALLVTAGAARAEDTQSMCEYSHPQHPGWDYFEPCSVSVTEAAGKRTTRATVANGSSFTVEAVSQGDGSERLSVNGRPATRLAREGSACFSTVAAQETICIHPSGTEAPLAPVVPSGAAADETAGASTPGIGGGEQGFCLLTDTSGDTTRLVDHGACARAENCQAEAETGEQSCLTLYVWKNGRENGIYRTRDWIALDGAEVSETAPGCWGGDAGPSFCFAGKDWTAAEQPVLAGPITLAPSTPVADAMTADDPASAASSAAAPLYSPLADAASASASAVTATTGLCRFLKDGVAITTQPCRQTRACADDSCDVRFSLDTGLGVHINVVSDQVISIDGQTTGPMPMPGSGAICVPYLSSPFIFCFAPS